MNTEKLINDLVNSINQKCPSEKRSLLEKKAADFWYGGSEDRLLYAVTEPPAKIRDLPPLPEEGPRRDLIICLTNVNNYLDFDSDFYPALNSGLKQNLIPSLFGCTEYTAGTSVAIKPVAYTPDEINALRPAFAPETTGARVLGQMDYMYKRTGLPLYMTDMQGPFSVACHIVGFERLIELIYDGEGCVKRLLDLVTEEIDKYFDAMYRITEGNLVPLHCHPMVFLPRGKGVAISDDYLAICSPEIIAEYSLPYIQKIANKRGGFTVHTCGNLSHQIDLLNKTEGLIAVNFSSTETHLEDAIVRLEPDIIILTHNSPVATGKLKILSPLEHLRECNRLSKAHNRRIIALCLAFDYDTYAQRDEFKKITENDSITVLS